MIPEQGKKLDRILGGALPRTVDERFEVLQAWLQKHNARWHNEGKYGRADLEGFIINGHVVYVLHMPDGSGWDILMPVSDRNNIAATLWAAERACGLEANTAPSAPGTKHPWHSAANHDCPWAMGDANYCTCQPKGDS